MNWRSKKALRAQFGKGCAVIQIRVLTGQDSIVDFEGAVGPEVAGSLLTAVIESHNAWAKARGSEMALDIHATEEEV